MESLVSTQWLANEMGASDLRIVDCTKHLPGTGRDPQAEYEAGHIPGAVFMDLGDLVDSNAPVENTLPPAEKFASRMQSLGLGDGSRIVLYDDSAVKTSSSIPTSTVRTPLPAAPSPEVPATSTRPPVRWLPAPGAVTWLTGPAASTVARSISHTCDTVARKPFSRTNSSRSARGPSPAPCC